MDYLKTKIIVRKLQEIRASDPCLDKALALVELDYEHPNLFNLVDDFDKEKVKISVDLKKIKSDLETCLLNELIEVYQCLTGEQFLSSSKWSIIHLIKGPIKNFKEDCKANDELDSQIHELRKQFKKVACDYLNYIKKNTQEFKLDFKLEYDKVTSNALCCKAQAYILKKRHEEIESITKHYGRADIIQALERKRRNLEDENTALKAELKDCKELLKQYESLDPELMKEYNKVKEELNCRRWACKIADRSSNSSISSVTD